MTMISTGGGEARETAATPLNRRDFSRMLGVSTLGLTLAACTSAEDAGASEGATMAAPRQQAPTQTADSQAALSADDAVRMLREGNERFVSGAPAARDLAAQVQQTASGQYPFAIVLGCVDSRVPIEVVFDQGIGDIFSARVAGNIVNGDLLGSMEFACAVAGSKAVVVLGHTACGAVKGSISQAELGNLTGLVQKIEPAVQSVDGERDVDNATYVDAVAEANVGMVLDEIRTQSPVLAEMESNGDIHIVGAMYDVASGEVRWL